MTTKSKRILRYILITPLILITGFITFILYETKDEVNANFSNIDQRLNRYYNQKRMGGFAVSVFNGDSLLYSKGIGYADLENKIPYTKSTQQFIASVSKTTIGIALMKAEELGLLKVENPVNKYLPFDVVNPKHPNVDITIQHLATHTSSLDYNESVIESLYIDESQQDESLESFMLAYFKNKEYGEVKFTDDAPNTNWNYSNIGASLAAYIIEEVSGVSYSEFTKQHIFKPLEMSNTFWFESRSDSTLHTTYYEPTSDSIQTVQTSGVKLYPSRDLITDIEDLTRYCQAIIARNPKLLTATSFEKLLSPKVGNYISNQEVDNCGLFFMIDRNKYGITYQLTGLNGGDNCINTMMWFDPKTELGFIFIGNTGHSKLNKSNHIWLYRALVSLGDHHIMENSSIGGKIKHKWHNLYNRVRGLF